MEHRVDLALAFALDTVTAALASDAVRAVIVVTHEPEALRTLTELGALVVSDEPDAGLNPALVHGATVAARAHPGTAVGALSADLPALRPDELSAALAAAMDVGTAFVRDAQGSGTTTLLARRAGDFAPAFGPESAAAHLRGGAVELHGDAFPSLRQDVDTAADLEQALAWAWVRTPRPSPADFRRSAPDRPRVDRIRAVQATVRSFSSATRAGTVLFDDGVELPYDAAAFDASRLRLLRVGQRVRLRVEGEGADDAHHLSHGGHAARPALIGIRGHRTCEDPAT